MHFGDFIAYRCIFSYIFLPPRQQLKLTNDNELVGADLNHLLTEESAAATLDKVEVGVDLVGTIDGDIELGVRVEGDEGDVEALGLLLGPDGGGDANDVLELAGLEELADALDGVVGGTAGAKSDDHAGLDVVVDGLVAHHLLELVLGKLLGHVESSGGGGVVASDRGADGGGERRSGRGDGSKAGGRSDAHLGDIGGWIGGRNKRKMTTTKSRASTEWGGGTSEADRRSTDGCVLDECCSRSNESNQSTARIRC